MWETLAQPAVQAVASAVVALSVAGLAYILTRRSERLDRLLRLHEYFDSKEMIEVRQAAVDTLRGLSQTFDDLDQKSPGAPIPRTYDVIPRGLASLDNGKLYRVVRFYQRLSVLSDSGNVPAAMIPRLFGETFVWWYCASFGKHLAPTEAYSAREIRKLAESLHRTARQDLVLRRDWNLWIDRAEASLAKQYDLPAMTEADHGLKRFSL